jgi:hypothetical protein
MDAGSILDAQSPLKTNAGQTNLNSAQRHTMQTHNTKAHVT